MRCWWRGGGWCFTRPGGSWACFISFPQTSKSHSAKAVLQHSNTKEPLAQGQSADMPRAGTPQAPHAERCPASLPCSPGGFCSLCFPHLRLLILRDAWHSAPAPRRACTRF